MRAGRLRHLVTIEKYTETQDAVGQPISAYTTFAQAWCSIQPMLGRENFAEQMVSTEQTHKINMRYISGIDSTMRLKFGTRYFEIIGNPINFMERNTYLTFNVKELYDHDTVHPIT